MFLAYMLPYDCVAVTKSFFSKRVWFAIIQRRQAHSITHTFMHSCWLILNFVSADKRATVEAIGYAIIPIYLAISYQAYAVERRNK